MPDTSDLNIQQMRDAAGDAVKLLRSLSHEDRLLLLCQLSQQELCVSELEDKLDIHQPNLSQHLGILRRNGLITPRRDGKHIYYHVSDPAVLAMLQTLYRQFCH
ncbi:MAG TPA: metalloregulator ArsR/SmtB family transcription factor [Pseudomonadales bacterium]